jgi:hypothetical protein
VKRTSVLSPEKAVTPVVFQPIIGKKPWKVWKGVGSFLLFEFGRKHKDPNGNTRGSHVLWIYMANWRIISKTKEVAHSESSDAKIERAANILIQKKLEALILSTVVTQTVVRYGARLHFEGDCRVVIYMNDRDEQNTIFMLHTPSTVISYNYDGSLLSKPLRSRRS